LRNEVNCFSIDYKYFGYAFLTYIEEILENIKVLNKDDIIK